MTRRVLVADTAEGDRRIAAILSGYELRFVRTLEEARCALQDDGIDLVLIGVHFDDSRMFDLLRYVRANPGKVVPVHACREWKAGGQARKAVA